MPYSLFPVPCSLFPVPYLLFIFPLQTISKPYSSKGTVYLQEASILSLGKLQSDSNYIVEGTFSIESSCYIDDTGHFNAVEFVICYNQVMVVSLAYATKKKLLLCLQEMTVEEYYKFWPSNIYITRLDSTYKSVINSKEFFCKFEVIKERKGAKLSILKTLIELSDRQGGMASGEVDLAIKHS
ncbi:FcoT family thioesterase [Dapis sp. BLCC M229]|uniref:FcoT family thioesterase n=1 Tax=Dapis sp. BLCC M229 TaxID=3400188 RepID=UPI003CECBB3B